MRHVFVYIETTRPADFWRHSTFDSSWIDDGWPVVVNVNARSLLVLMLVGLVVALRVRAANLRLVISVSCMLFSSRN